METYAGKVVNPVLASLQCEGNVAFGVGQALFEEIELDGGQIVNPTLADYMIPSLRDLPERWTVGLAEDPAGGRVHGLGETGAPPVPAAIGNALFHATGVRLTTLPLTPEKVLAGLREVAAARSAPAPARGGSENPGMTPGTGWQAAVAEGDQLAVRCVLMRGGTSRGAFLLAEDLPAEPALRDRVMLAIYGSPDPRQIDGIGGADPLTSKVAIVSRSDHPGADVDYLFGQVRIEDPVVDYRGNCGNMLAAVGPFAIDEGLVAADEPITRVRIHNVNTGRLVVAEVPVLGGRARVTGDATIAGVPGSGAGIVLDFSATGATLGRGLLPTGLPREQLELDGGDAVTVSIVDAGAPAVFVAARELGLAGDAFVARPLEPAAIERLTSIRAAAAERPRARLRSGAGRGGDAGRPQGLRGTGARRLRRLARALGSRCGHDARRPRTVHGAASRRLRDHRRRRHRHRGAASRDARRRARGRVRRRRARRAHRPSGRRHARRGGRRRLRRASRRSGGPRSSGPPGASWPGSSTSPSATTGSVQPMLDLNGVRLRNRVVTSASLLGYGAKPQSGFFPYGMSPVGAVPAARALRRRDHEDDDVRAAGGPLHARGPTGACATGRACCAVTRARSGRSTPAG